MQATGLSSIPEDHNKKSCASESLSRVRKERDMRLRVSSAGKHDVGGAPIFFASQHPPCNCGENDSFTPLMERGMT